MLLIGIETKIEVSVISKDKPPTSINTTKATFNLIGNE